MSTPQSSALIHWARIIRRWPVDKVRPENVSFQTVMRKRIDRLSNPSSRASPANVKANDALVSAEPPKLNEKNEMQQINALYSFLENRYANAYPMPMSMRKPASNPSHYDDVLQELEEAPSRSWFSSVMKTMQGKFRFK